MIGSMGSFIPLRDGAVRGGRMFNHPASKVRPDGTVVAHSDRRACSNDDESETSAATVLAKPAAIETNEREDTAMGRITKFMTVAALGLALTAAQAKSEAP